MLERIALLLALSAVAVAAYYALRLLHLRRVRPVVEGTGTPALLYFRSDSCAACPAQGRIIDQMEAQWPGRLRVEWVDAERDPETAARYCVFTLPTTVLVGDDGRVRQINYGLTDTRKLGQQVAELLERPPAADDGQQTTDRGESLEPSLTDIRRPSSVVYCPPNPTN
jgi:thioredoxin-like negative regulator of GroEL